MNHKAKTQYRNLVEFFSDKASQFGDSPGFTCLDHTLSYAQMDKASDRLASYFHHFLKLERGDRIAIQLPNIIQYPIAVIAAFKAGLVVVNTNPLYTEREMLHQFRDAGVKAVVVLEDFAAKLAEVQGETAIRHVIITAVGDMHPPFRQLLINNFLRLKNLFKGHRKPAHSVRFLAALDQGDRQLPPDLAIPGDDLAVLQYTGGTTGVPKGAMLSHDNLLSNIRQIDAMLGDHLEPGREVMVAPLPIYHIFAFILCMGVAVNCGAQVLLLPDPRNMKATVKALTGIRFTLFAGLNTLFNALCRHDGFKQLDFSGLKITISGGMALTHATAERWQSVTGCHIIEGYGLTEASPVVAVNPVDAPRLGTVGKVLPETEIRLLDGDGRDVPKGEPGELLIRGPQVMSGYWKRPEDTRDTLDDNGWLHTGDVAKLEEDGYLSIVDRVKDMIVVSGFNVYPNEVEDEIARHPEVVECAVVGVPDPETVEAVKLFVVTSNPHLSAHDIKHFAARQLSRYKLPKYIEFVNSLPKSNVGKVLRKELRDQDQDSTAEPTSD